MSFKTASIMTAREVEKLEMAIHRDVEKAIFFGQDLEIRGLRAIQLKLRELQISLKTIKRDMEEMEQTSQS